MIKQKGMRELQDDFSRLELNLKAATENYRYFRSLLDPKTFIG